MPPLTLVLRVVSPEPGEPSSRARELAELRLRMDHFRRTGGQLEAKTMPAPGLGPELCT